MDNLFSILKFVLLLLSGVWCESPSTIRDLRKFVLDGYDVNARPVRNHENTTVVVIEFVPIHITEMNENKGILTIEAWVYMGWQDDHLRWNKKNFSGLSNLRLSEKEVWKPDITIWEGRGSKISPWHASNLEVNNTGYVVWTPAATIQVYCGNFDYEDYPHDSQTCTITLGPWTHDIKNIDLEVKTNNMTFHEYSFQNPHWELVNIVAKKEDIEVEEEGSDEVYATIEYELELERVHVPYTALEYMPITVAANLILGMFWLTSPTRKLLLGCSCLLILTCVSVGITVILPSPAAATAALFKVSCSMALCTTAIAVEIAVTALFCCTLSPPAWMEKLAKSSPCRFITFCQMPGKSSKEDTQQIISDEKNNTCVWAVLGILVDRIAFVGFAILLLAL